MNLYITKLLEALNNNNYDGQVSISRSHCEIDRIEKGANLCDLLLQLCDLVALLVVIFCTNIRRKKILCYISGIHNTFVLLNSSFRKGVMIENIKDLNLTCHPIPSKQKVELNPSKT